jgi:hypothetical protein
MKKTLALCLLISLGVGCGRGDDDDDDGGDNGGADGGGDDDATIFEVQSESMPVGTAVTVRGVVVTAIDNYGDRRGGIYVQEPEGGEFSGVFVYLSGTEAADLAVGDLVDLDGFVKDEFAWQTGCESEDQGSLTELSPAEGSSPTVTKVGDGDLPAPPVLVPWELAASVEESEKWEGVPITFENVRVFAPPSDDDTVDQVTMRVTGPYDVQASLTELADTITEGACYSSITGIGDYFFDYKILPRSPADLVLGDDADCLPVENVVDLCGDDTDNDHNGANDCADFGCQEVMPEECTVVATVADIQSGEIARNTRVRLEELVIIGRAFNDKRYWVSDDVASSAPETGIFIFRPGEAEELPAAYRTGATVTLEASVDERLAGCNGNLTQLSFAEAVVAPTGAGAGPSPMTDVPLATLASETEGEAYEGTVVRVQNVTVKEINQNENFNLEFTVTDGTSDLVVDDDIFRFEDVSVGECLTITGIMHYSTFDNSQDGGLPPHTVLLPRSGAEIASSGGCE